MKLSIKAGETSVSVNVFIQDSSSTTGAGLTGLVYDSAGLTAYYALPRAAAVSISLATLAAVTSSYSSGGFKEIDATNMPGWYRLDIPNAALASGRFSCLHLKGATDMAPLPIEIELTGWDNQDAVRGGLTALPNVASGNAGAVITSGTGTAQLSVSSGRANADVTHIATAAVSASTAQLGVNVVQAGATAWASGAITAASIAADAITAAKIADGAIDAGAIASAAFTAAKFDADCLTAAKFAADVTTEFQSGLATAANLATVAGYLDTEILAIKAVTDQFVFGTANRVNCQVFGMETDSLSAVAVSIAGANKIADGVLNRSAAAVEGSAPMYSLTAVILASFESIRDDETWTIYRTDGSTVFQTLTLTTDATSAPITGVSA